MAKSGQPKRHSTFLDSKRGVTPGTGTNKGTQAAYQQTKRGVGGKKNYNLPRKTF